MTVLDTPDVDPEPVDPRVTRARAIAGELVAAQEHLEALSAERRRLLLELRDDGYSMAGIATAVGISRQWLYKILGPVETDRRDGGMRCEHGFLKPCTECDPYVASKAKAAGKPVSTPPP